MTIDASIWKDKRFLSLGQAEKLAIIAGYTAAINTPAGLSFNWIMVSKALATEDTDPIFASLRDKGWINGSNIITRTEFVGADL